MNDSFKGKDVLDYLRQRKYGIYVLQETHMTTESEKNICALHGITMCGQLDAVQI